MKGILIAAGVAALAFTGGRVLFSNSFSSKVKKLYRLQQGLRKQNVWESIENLPDPVQRYLKKALNGNTAAINEVRLKHNGFFKTSPPNCRVLYGRVRQAYLVQQILL